MVEENRLEILKKVATGELSPEEADKQLSDINHLIPNDDTVANSVLTICLVPHGYQMDLISHKAYLNRKIDVIHSECRDYGGSIDVAEFSRKILNFVRNGDES